MSGKLPAAAFAITVSVLAGTVSSPAAGPVDGEVVAIYWATDGDALGESGPELDGGALSGTAEIWLFERWGARVGLYEAEFADLDEEVSYTSADLLAKILKLSRNNYVAVGVGWEDIELASVVETSGPRFVAEGRVGLGGLVYGYAQVAYLADLDEFDGGEDVDGTEFDLGIVVEPLPFLTLRAGYRNTTIEFTATASGQQIESEAEGFHAGVGIHF
jgi:hypothetical protein